MRSVWQAFELGCVVLWLSVGISGQAQTPLPHPAETLPRPVVPPPPTEEGALHDFNFDQVDVGTFVKLVGEITGRRIVLGEGVQGKITVTAPRVKRADIFPLFVSILESVGCSVVEDAGLYRVVPLPSRSFLMAPVVGSAERGPDQGIVTKVFRLAHISATEVKRALEGQVGGGKGGAVAALDETNHLIVTDTVGTIRRIERIVAEVDRPGMTRVTEVYSLKFASADDLADEINRAYAESESRADAIRKRLPVPTGGNVAGAGRQSAFVVPAPHANSLILVGTSSQIAELKSLLQVMDIDTQTGRGRLNAIFLRYLSAHEAATNINSLLTRSAARADGTPQRRISVEASAANNALLVDASPADFDVVSKLVDQLDRAPEQVHIEVVIAEVNAATNLNLGVEMVGVQMPSEPGATTFQGGSLLREAGNNLMTSIQQSVFPRGITVGAAYGGRVDAEGKVTASYPGMINIEALRRNGRVNIHSRTSLDTQNNREASVNIVNQIPILKSTVTGGSGTARDVIQNIDRLDVGIRLKLLPSVIPGRQVRMTLNPCIEAVIDTGASGTSLTPTIARREVSTTVTVPDGQTIIIAGLTREDKKKVVNKVPILGSIPLLGFFFRSTSDSFEKTDMIIFVTPQIVTEKESASRVMDDWKKKTGISAP